MSATAIALTEASVSLPLWLLGVVIAGPWAVLPIAVAVFLDVDVLQFLAKLAAKENHQP